MAEWKCSKCGFIKDSRCKPRKCPECGASGSLEKAGGAGAGKKSSCNTKKKRSCKK